PIPPRCRPSPRGPSSARAPGRRHRPRARRRHRGCRPTSPDRALPPGGRSARRAAAPRRKAGRWPDRRIRRAVPRGEPAPVRQRRPPRPAGGSEAARHSELASPPPIGRLGSMRRLLLSLALLCIGATCGDADPDVIDVGPGDDPGAHEPPVHRIRMGPLANAGPDQFALPGMPVRLDGRGTTPPEDGRPLRYRWLQEAGPRVLLSDPTSPVTEFVAPSIRPGSGDRLVFRLVVEDGAARSVDRMVVRLVESSDRLEFAPAVIAGAEIETRPGQEVEIPPPTFLATACLDREDREKCLATPLPYCWSQVAEPRVALQGACGEGPTYFSAPAVESLLVFRVDAHAHADSPAPSACGPEADIVETPPCAAPDYLRVVVRAVPRRGEELPPTSLGGGGQSIGPPAAETTDLGGVLNDIPAQLDAVGSGDDRAERWRFVPRFRAVLGQPRLRPLPGQADLLLGIEGNRAHVYSPPWPGLV